ncbi:tautomerase family protein [Paenibacillus sp. MCAF20]
MSFIRVSYRENQYESKQLESISKTIMNSLIQHFHVPADDCFQVFHAHKSSEFVYDTNYLDIERSDGLLYIQITLKSGRTIQQKTSFYTLLAEQLSIVVGIRQEDVFVVLVGTEFEDWSFGNGQAQMLERKKMAATNVRASLGELAPAFVDYSENVLFGDLWKRERLSLRDRSLVTLSALVASGQTEQLPYHLRLAIDHGLTREEIIEAITHLAYYAGWPRAASALETAKNVFPTLPVF